MIRYIKQGVSERVKVQEADQVRHAVEDILGQIELHGDHAVRELSQKFDGWSPESFCL